MNGEFMFGVRKGKLTAREERRRERIARKHGVVFNYGDFPGNGWMSWFAGPNYGEPFDGALARAVRSDIERSEGQHHE